MKQQSQTMLSNHDKKIISDIVSNYHAGDRVKVLRFIFKNEATYEHFIYLGEVMGLEIKHNLYNQEQNQIFRLKTLSYLN